MHIARELSGHYNHCFLSGPQKHLEKQAHLCVIFNYDIHSDDYEITWILMSYVSANLYCK